MESEVVQWFYITCQEINVGLGRLDSSSTYMYSPYLFFFFLVTMENIVVTH